MFRHGSKKGLTIKDNSRTLVNARLRETHPRQRPEPRQINSLKTYQNFLIPGQKTL